MRRQAVVFAAVLLLALAACSDRSDTGSLPTPTPTVTVTNTSPQTVKPIPTKTAAPAPLLFFNVWHTAHRHRHANIKSIGQEFRASGTRITELWLRIGGNRVQVTIMEGTINGGTGAELRTVHVNPVSNGITKVRFTSPVRVRKGGRYVLFIGNEGSDQMSAWFSDGNDQTSLTTVCESAGDAADACPATAGSTDDHGHDLNARIYGRA